MHHDALRSARPPQRSSYDVATPPQSSSSSRCALGLALLLCGCSQRTANAEEPLVSRGPTSEILSAQPASGAAAALIEETDDAESQVLRRGYGSVDMRFHSCVTRESDRVLRGDGCLDGFVIYGPYVRVPANSNIEVSFEIEPRHDVEIYGDIAARMGKSVLAGLNPQAITAGTRHKLGYHVNVFSDDAEIESRIGFRSSAPVSFVLSDLIMTVR